MKPYYEGWYMKQQQEDDVLAVIPGRAQDTAFIQVITQHESHYLTFPLSSYRIDNPKQTHGESVLRPCMRVGENTFGLTGLELHIREPDFELVGALQYQNLTPLRSDIMGPFALLPMETKHTVFSMRHRVDGSMRLNGKSLRFDNAVGYMEGDRGHSFPQGYTWVQSIDLPDGASIMLAIAEIPLGFIHFTGCIGVVMLNGTEHRFATYRGVHIAQASERVVEVAQRNMSLRVEVLESQGHSLQAPDQGSMRRSIHESPAVPARFIFTKHGKTLLDCTSEHASYEHVPLK